MKASGWSQSAVTTTHVVLFSSSSVVSTKKYDTQKSKHRKKTQDLRVNRQVLVYPQRTTHVTVYVINLTDNTYFQYQLNKIEIHEL